MSYKTLELSVTGLTDYVKQIYFADSNDASDVSDSSYTIHTEQSIGDVGFGYDFVRRHYSYGWIRHRYARTWCTVLKFGGVLLDPTPSSATNYTGYKVIIPWERSADIPLNVCILMSALPSGAQSAYQKLRSLSVKTTINASSGVTVALTEAELRNVLTYGLALVPAGEAAISDISSYTDITENTYGETRRFVRSAQLLKAEVKLRYDVQNLASPGTASAVTPSQASVLVANRDSVISWKYTQEFAAAQHYIGITATDLSTGAVTAICRKAVRTAENGTVSSYTIPAGTLSVGKVRLTLSVMPEAAADHFADSDAVWTSGTTVGYTVKYAPTASSVTCDGKPVPTVSWTSTAQAAYQVRFGDYDSGVRIGGASEFTVPKIFPDGTYAVSVRTSTAAGEWSDWTEETYVTVSNTALSGTVTASAEVFGGNIRIIWESTVSSPDNFALFRDGVLIAVTAGTSFVDRFANGTAVYTVYAVKNGNYLASAPVSFTLRLTADRISSDDGYTYKPLKFTPSPKSQTDARSENVSYHYFSGRTKPVAVSGGQTERTKQFLYIFRNRAEAEFLQTLAGRPVLLKTTRGSVIYGILNDLQITEARLTTAAFSVREIYREEEEVDYVP